MSPAQVREIVERAGNDKLPDAKSDLALLAPSLRRILDEQARHEILYALIRGLLVLATFPVDGTPRRLSEIAAELAMKTTTVHRYVATLVAAGLLAHDGETRRYFRQGRLSV